jgi:hypothetical protein
VFDQRYLGRAFWSLQWIKKDPPYSRYILQSARAMAMPLAKDGRVFLPVLWKGEAPIGAHLALIDAAHKTLVCVLVSRDLSIKKPPPGLVLHAYAMRWAIGQGFKYYDLLRGNFSYKYSFGPEERRFESLRINTANRKNLGGGLEPRAMHIAVDYARKCLLDGKRANAERGCRQILENQPDNAEAQKLLAEIAPEKPFDTPAKPAAAVHKRGEPG